MKRLYLFKKGGIFNPIKTSKEFRDFAFTNKNCKMYIVDDENIKEYLDVWQKLRDNNIEMMIVEKR